MMRRTILPCLLSIALSLAGCRAMGARGTALLPLEIARTRPAPFFVYHAVMPQQRQPYDGRLGDVFSLAGQRFLTQFPDFAGPSSMLVPVATEAGAPVFALRWGRPPYDRLYVSPGGDRVQVAPPIWR